MGYGSRPPPTAIPTPASRTTPFVNASKPAHAMICGDSAKTIVGIHEYIAGGLPVLASDLPVIAGVVSEYQLGEVVPPSDLEAIAAGVRRLLEPERRAAVLDGIRSFVLANPWSAESEILAGVYAGMLDRHAG